MHTLEAIIVIPAVLLFILIIICVSLKYSDMVSKHADEMSASVSEEVINHTDVVRGGVVLDELYGKYAG